MNNYNLINSIFRGIGFIIIVGMVNIQNLWLVSEFIQKIIDFINA
jgi:hypothetical protein